MRRTPHRLRWLAVGVATVALTAAGAALVWRLGFRDDSRPAEVGAAVTRFRSETTGTRSRAGLPGPGVYVYATTGFERIDALGGVRHAYPARTTITVRAAPCGVSLRWDVLAARATTWEQCLDTRGLVRTGSRETHRFYGRTEVTTYACGQGWLLVPRRAEAGRSWPLHCAEEQGASERGTGSVVGFETLRVAGRSVRTLHVRQAAVLSGHTRGSSRDDLWLRTSDRLLVKLVTRSDTTNPSLVGAVHYVERATLALISLEPRR